MADWGFLQQIGAIPQFTNPTGQVGETGGGVLPFVNDPFAWIGGGPAPAPISPSTPNLYPSGGSPSNPLGVTGGATGGGNATRPGSTTLTLDPPTPPAPVSGVNPQPATAPTLGDWSARPKLPPCGAVARLTGLKPWGVDCDMNPDAPSELTGSSAAGTLGDIGRWLSKAGIQIAIGALALLLLVIALWPHQAVSIVNQLRPKALA